MKMNGIKIKLTKNSNYLKDAGYTPAEEVDIYASILEDVYNNPRWYLDNLAFLPEFRLSWGNYRNNRGIKPKPL